MEIEVAKEKEEAASEQGEGSVYFFFKPRFNWDKIQYTVYVCQ